MRVWHLDTPGRAPLLIPYPAPAAFIVFDGTSRLMAVATGDRQVRVWDPESGAALSPAMQTPDIPWGLSFSPHRRWLCAVGEHFLAAWSLSGAGGPAAISLPISDLMRPAQAAFLIQAD